MTSTEPTQPPARRKHSADVAAWSRVVVVWVLTRAAAVALLVGLDPWVADDLRYYAASLARGAEQGGWWTTLVEYPLPGVALLQLPWTVLEALGASSAYVGVAVGLLLALDAGFLYLLARSAGGPGPALTPWLWGAPLLGATTYARFDLLPGLLAGSALLVVATRPRVAAACVALATAIKLWPVVLIPGLVLAGGRRVAAAVVVAAVGLLTAGASVAAGGWDRLFSPLTWQVDRGLHMESVAATPAVAVWVVDPDRYRVAKSTYNAWEIAGPGTDALLVLTTLATGGTLVFAALLALRAWRRGGASGDLVGWTAVAAVLLLVGAGKVFSPQYVLWLLPVAAAALAVGSPAGRAMVPRWWVAALLLLTGCTQVVFPLFYGVLITHGPGVGMVAAVLVVRNVLVVVLGVVAVRAAWRSSGAPLAAPERPDPLSSRPGRART